MSPTSARDSANPTAANRERSMCDIYQEYQQVGCLGHGGYGSVFLAKRRSGRQVAVKMMDFSRLDSDKEVIMEVFFREVDTLRRLNRKSDDNRDQALVFMEDCFIGRNFAGIVMNYVDGGTLAQEIEKKSARIGTSGPFSERRIAWYILQLSEALAYAHEQGVAHHDVKSSNVLVDKTGGGKLLLADFGSSVGTGQESVQFSEVYASPELRVAYENQVFSNLDKFKIDSFGIGCIMFELLCCKRLADLSAESTLGEYLSGGHNSVDSLLESPYVCLPWLQKDDITSAVGYSFRLKRLAASLLDANPVRRWSPGSISSPLRESRESPLLADFIVASESPVPGAPVTVDNIQLGMFVQRGADWSDGDADGGKGSIGVVVKIDADAGYTEAVFASGGAGYSQLCWRIGSGNVFELQVGPPAFMGEVDTARSTPAIGLLQLSSATSYQVGQEIQPGILVVSVAPDVGHVFVAPKLKTNIHSREAPTDISDPGMLLIDDTRKPQLHPDTWDDSSSMLVEVGDGEERNAIVELFHAPNGGLSREEFSITSIQRFQSEALWNEFAVTREKVAAENWAVANERHLFCGGFLQQSESLLNASTPTSLWGRLTRFSSMASYSHLSAYACPNGSSKQLLVYRVVLGRIDYQPGPRTWANIKYHSAYSEGSDGRGGVHTLIDEPSQIYPEYVLTYSMRRRIVRARRANLSNPNPVARRVAPTSPPSTMNSDSRPSRGGVTSNVPQTTINRATPALRVSSRPSSDRTAAAVAQGRPIGSHKTFIPKLSNGKTAAFASNSGGKTKQCVVCWSRPVNRIFDPCGHASLCEVCSTEGKLCKMGRKCPECRARIQKVIPFFGRLVED